MEHHPGNAGNLIVVKDMANAYPRFVVSGVNPGAATGVNLYADSSTYLGTAAFNTNLYFSNYAFSSSLYFNGTGHLRVTMYRS